MKKIPWPDAIALNAASGMIYKKQPPGMNGISGHLR